MSIEGINRRPPPGAPTVIAAGTTASNMGIYDQLVTVVAVGGALTMRFGDSAVGAAATTDWPLAEGEKETFWISSATSYCSIQGSGATLTWYAG